MKTVPQAALQQHIAVLGKTGSGKTYAAKGIVEHLLDQRRQVCVLDPTGAWWGLRLASNGEAQGYDIVLLGGAHADIPLAEKSGAAVARLVTEQRASVVIDTSGFTVGEYTRWFIDFAGTLYTTIRAPLHLVIDEAHYFMPQGKSPDVDAGRMLHAGNRLMSGGRSKGIRGLLITQRPAKLHKDSLTCADTLIAMRVIAPQDRQAIKDWIDGAGDQAKGKVVLDSLAALKRGEGWVWYPEGGHLERVTFPTIGTYDSSATPKHGAKAGPEPGAIKLEEVQAAMAEAVREAEANDPKLLRQKLAELKRQLSARSPTEKTVEKIVEVPVLKDGQLDRTEKAAERMEKYGQQFLAEAAELRRLIAPTVAPRQVQRQVVTTRSVAVKPLSPRSNATSERLPPGERAVLVAATQYQGVARNQLSVLTGYKRSSRDAYIARLREKVYVEISGDTITATQAGADALGTDYDPLPTGDALLSYWLGRLPEGERKTLEVLVSGYPNSVPREQIDEATGYKRSSRDAYLARLKSRRLVEFSGRGEAKASDGLFG